MKQLTIVVKPFRADAVLQAVADMDITSCVVREAKGYSRQKGYLDRYLGSEYSMAFLPKVEITLCVNDDRVAEVIDHGRDGEDATQPLVESCLGHCARSSLFYRKRSLVIHRRR